MMGATGKFDANTPRTAITQNPRGAWIVEGHRAISIPAMIKATTHVVARAKETGLAAIALKDALWRG